MNEQKQIQTSTTDIVPKKSKGKIRLINREKWKDVSRKCLRDAGLEYTAKKSKKIVPAKSAPSNERICGKHCTQMCSQLKLETRKELFNYFYSLTYDLQSFFLIKCIKIGEPQRRRAGKTDATSPKLRAFTYFVNDKKVCKKTLLDVFKISHRRIQTLQNKLKDGIDLPVDNRGKHQNRPHAILNEKRDLIRQHINKFRNQESHCTKTDTEYLSSDLNLSKLYRYFQDENPDIKMSKSLYEKVFKEMNLRFGPPQPENNDTLYDTLYVHLFSTQSEHDMKSMQMENDLHQR